MLFGKTEDQKQIAEMLNARAYLVEGLSERCDKKKLEMLLEKYEAAVQTYMNTLKKAMERAMGAREIARVMTKSEEGDMETLEGVLEMKEFIEGMISEVYCFKMRVAKQKGNGDGLSATIDEKVGELKANQFLTGEMKKINDFMDRIHDSPTFDVDMPSSKADVAKFKKEQQAIVDNFVKVKVKMLPVHEIAKVEAGKALQSNQQNKR